MVNKGKFGLIHPNFSFSTLGLVFHVVEMDPVRNPEWTKFRTHKIPNGQNPESYKIPNWTKFRMDKIPNGKNPELDKIQNRQNLEWDKILNRAKRRIEQNPELDKIPNWTKSRMDKILKGKSPEWTKSKIEPTSKIEKARINCVIIAGL